MSGDNFTDGIPKFRSILGDITNRSVKRGFSSISDNVGFNSKEEASYRFTKQVCLREENPIQENPKPPQFEPNPNTSSTCSGETDTSKEGLVPVNEKVSEVIERFDLSDSDDRLDQGEGITQARGTLNDSCRNDSRDLGVGRLASSEGGCVEWLRLPKSSSQGFRSFELERCVGLKNDVSNLNAGADMLKACSCSFCLKVLKRSQKEASILVQKSCSGKETDIQNLGNPNKSSKLESDLTSQWRSLFLNMEDIFVHESNQLVVLCSTLARRCTFK
ncbi:hypothetical protein ERO13_D11G056300v2 [Gossypium hirsutum]|uniref:Uncharacterized protein n=4 Tax=Gossypium TaxID=3633 RepID=A0A5D2SPC2_GOSMU|nr:uncharacterized protein LOC107911645 isoform X4 [Gossypium hirsutum]KAB2002336.1 hypothetical protein ES319_D11G059400v1 [Gossypium barbadense]TYH42397.1 hypothetical protein ES332_D11G061000v1 [Gossypium tomentosum]TYI54223.1 hypothetical protein E1A91_D11G060600v1 [Gossypium mustelinum]KAG4119077.1 hypothetical protein ERO13_D11G056300v2 [Gossypium hirsutum]KAG4119078.1 hypothetical protein ERO13_D11G056300v2 [Gossypium hirsutum]